MALADLKQIAERAKSEGRRQGLLEAAELLSSHCETTSNVPPYRYLSPRRGGQDLTNTAFIEKLRDMANGSD